LPKELFTRKKELPLGGRIDELGVMIEEFIDK
jgi:hypothetical protein